MNYLTLSIVGPTGTGKTKLAVYLSQLFPSILISADSRQVYTGMDIVTGKDHPSGVTLHGLDIVKPDLSFSVSKWYDSIQPIIQQAIGENQLIVVVGGTGFYLRAITNGIPTMHIPINPSLRTALSILTVGELRTRLNELAPAKLSSMNNSDAHNSRRLIRAIEVATAHPAPIPSLPQPQNLTLGLRYADTSQYESVVRARVLARLDDGAITETERLLHSSSSQALSAIGYQSIVAHLKGSFTYTQMVDHWVHDELAYAKRQMTYFRKIPDVHWYEASSLDFNLVASEVKAWYDKAKVEEVRL